MNLSLAILAILAEENGFLGAYAEQCLITFNAQMGAVRTKTDRCFPTTSQFLAKLARIARDPGDEVALG